MSGDEKRRRPSGPRRIAAEDGWRQTGRRPDFFVVGAPKSGTSSLYNYLIQHADVFLPDNKEPHFFYNRAAPGSPVLGRKDPSEYLRLFEGVPEDIRAGEASTSYLHAANAAREIKRFQPDAKIMAVLRNPVDRAYSQYWNQVRDGAEPLSFEEALEAEPRRIRRGLWSGFYYVEVGLYAEQVARYLDVFGREMVRVYLFEDLVRDALGVCRDAFAFLGVDPNHPVDAKRVYNRSGPPKNKTLSKLLNARSVKGLARKALPAGWTRAVAERLRDANRRPTPEMDPRTRAMLQEGFEENILRLEQVIGRDLSGWRV